MPFANTTRFDLEWVLESAGVRQQEWQARAEGADMDDDRVASVYEETPHNANNIAVSLGVAITHVRENVCTKQEALMAMMIWEWAICQKLTPEDIEEDECVLADWLADGEGAYQGRDNALLIAPLLMPASEWAYENGFDDSEDWEFLPRLMYLILERTAAPSYLTRDHALACAKQVVMEYLEKRETEVTPLVEGELDAIKEDY